jgi:hypothetical protein
MVKIISNYIRCNKVFLLLVIASFFLGVVIKYFTAEPAVLRTSIKLSDSVKINQNNNVTSIQQK